MRCRRQTESIFSRYTRLLWPILGRSGPAWASSRLVSKRLEKEESGNSENCNETQRKTEITAVPGDSWVPSWPLFRALGLVLGGSWPVLDRSSPALGKSGASLGRSWPLWVSLGPVLATLGQIWVRSWGGLGPLWVSLGPLVAAFGGPWAGVRRPVLPGRAGSPVSHQQAGAGERGGRTGVTKGHIIAARRKLTLLVLLCLQAPLLACKHLSRSKFVVVVQKPFSHALEVGTVGESVFSTAGPSRMHGK
jgi:hypothetical protein